jgi:hypothetical protein
MKKILFLLIAMAAAAVSLMAQTPQKIVPPSIAILMPEKVEMDDFCKMYGGQAIKTDSADSKYFNKEQMLREGNTEKLINQFEVTNNKTLAERQLGITAIFLEKMINGMTYTASKEKIGQGKVELIDQILPQNLSAQHNFAVKNGVRFVLNPKKYIFKGSKKEVRQSIELVLYDTVLRKNIAVKTLSIDEDYNNVFTLNMFEKTNKKIQMNSEAVFLKLPMDILELIMANTLLTPKDMKSIKNTQKAQKAKIDSLYTAQPNPEIVALAMPLLEEDYKEDLELQAKGNYERITKPLSKNFYGTFFNEDKTKFIAFFAQNIMEEDTDYKGKLFGRVVTRTGPSLEGQYFVGIYKNKKWYIEKISKFHYPEDKKKECLVWKKDDFLREMKSFFNEKNEPNPGFWQKEEFKTMQDVQKGLADRIIYEEQEDAKYNRAENIKQQQKMLKQFENQLELLRTGTKIKQNRYSDNPAEGMTDTIGLKEQIEYTKDGLIRLENNEDKSSPYSMVKNLQEESAFYQDQYPEGYELVVKMQLDSIKREIDDFEDDLRDKEVRPFLQKMLRQRPDLYQDTKDWQTGFDDNRNFLSNKKHYFIATTQVFGERKVGGVYKHHYLLLDIQTKKWYEWTYPETNKPSIPAKEQWRANAVFEQLAKWNDNYPMLNDPAFWANYVLKQNDGAYLYLKPIAD